MNYDTYKREWVEAFTPWKREPKEYPDNSPGFSSDYESFNPKRQRFYLHAQNKHLDVYTKMAALKTSTSVVSLESYSGKEEIFQCSGTIIESVDTSSIILTAASLLRCSKARNSIADDIKVIVHLFDGRAFDGHIEAYDFHYNVAAIRIQSDTPLPIASLAHLNDSIMIRPSQLRVTEEKPFQLRPHSNSFHLIPGDSVIALGRFNKKPYDIMAAPGEFRTHGHSQIHAAYGIHDYHVGYCDFPPQFFFWLILVALIAATTTTSSVKSFSWQLAELQE